MMKDVFSLPIKVRSYELDSYQHVNNAVYLQYLEYARAEFMNAIGLDYLKMLEDGIMLYVTRVKIDYKKSARFNDILRVEVFPTKLGKLSGVFFQRILNDKNDVCVEAEVKWGCVNKDSKPVPLPEKYRVPGLYPKNEEPICS